MHSGHWGGLTTDPAICLTHALASIIDPRGKILVRDWLPRNGVPAEVRAALAGCPVGAGDGAASATIDADWGEPGLTPAEKIYGWNSFIVLAMLSGQPENPMNAVAPSARATCHIRYTVDTDPLTFEAALRRHLDAEGFPEVGIENARVRMAGQPHRARTTPGCSGRSRACSGRSEAGAGDPEQLGRPAGRRLRRPARRADGLGAAQLQRLQAARPGRAFADRPGAGGHRWPSPACGGISARAGRRGR